MESALSALWALIERIAPLITGLLFVYLGTRMSNGLLRTIVWAIGLALIITVFIRLALHLP